MNEKYFVNPHGGVHGNSDIITPLGRAAFVYLAKRNERFVNQTTGRGKYGVTVLFDKKDENVVQGLKEIQEVCNDMREFFATKEYEKSGKKMKYPEFRKSVIEKMAAQPVFRDGDTQKYDGFAGHWFMVAKNDENNGPKGIIFSGGRLPEEFEAGHLVRVQVQPYLDAKGFSYKLLAIKLVKDDGFRFQQSRTVDLLEGLDEAVDAVKAGGNGEASQNSLGAHYDRAVSGEPSSSDLNVL